MLTMFVVPILATMVIMKGVGNIYGNPEVRAILPQMVVTSVLWGIGVMMWGKAKDSRAHDHALTAIRTEWNSSADEAAIRNAWLMPGIDLLDDGVTDKLTGSSGRDWFFADLDGQDDDDDEVTDDTSNEVVDLLS